MRSRASRPSPRSAAVLAAVVAVVLGLAAAAWGVARATGGRSAPAGAHVFVINLENKGFATTFGPGSPAPYLSRTLVAQGNLLTQYYGVAHNSLPNYLAQISGQGPDHATQGDCERYTDFAQTGTAAPDQVVGDGCVYPASVQTLPQQLTAAGRTWKGYMEDMGNGPDGTATCRHPALDAPDDTHRARVGDQYAARHDPFVYFHAITDSPACATHVVPLDRLQTDLQTATATPDLSYISPDLCHDGHDAPCVDGQPGGLASADAFLGQWVPRILASPAFRQDGLLVVTFDESDSAQSDASSCCGEAPGPNSAVPGLAGPGGGRVGAVVVGPAVKPGSTTARPYNHYSLLASIEDLFGLPHLGYAQTVPTRFASDVYTAR